MLAEMNLMKELNHPNIMNCIDFYKEPKQFIIVMDKAQNDLWKYIF